METCVLICWHSLCLFLYTMSTDYSQRCTIFFPPQDPARTCPDIDVSPSTARSNWKSVRAHSAFFFQLHPFFIRKPDSGIMVTCCHVLMVVQSQRYAQPVWESPEQFVGTSGQHYSNTASSDRCIPSMPPRDVDIVSSLRMLEFRE